MQMPPITLPPSASGMRWFHTPEEYLSEWKPRIEFMAYTKESSRLAVCPNCGNSDPQKISFLVRRKKVDLNTWQCKRWICRQTWPVKRTLVFIEMTQEEWVFARINQRAANGPTMAQRMLMSSVGIPLGVTLGSVEAMSNNNQAHRDGTVIAAMSAYQHYQRQRQQEQWMDHLDRLHAAEAKRAWAMAESYFKVPQRAAQAAQNARYTEMQEMARIMAKEMFAEAARVRQ